MSAYEYPFCIDVFHASDHVFYAQQASFNMGTSMQNKSYAVMAQRMDPKDSRDDFPTPPWATRSLMEYVIPGRGRLKTCLEPACGAGHMAKVLTEYFDQVSAYDKYDYGFGHIEDFLDNKFIDKSFDWVITNPPFNLAERFVLSSMNIAREGVAILARTVFIESVGRYNRIFRDRPPSLFAQFTERVPMVKGRLDAKASTATGYCWLVWDLKISSEPRLVWIPPCRKILEKSEDYQCQILKD